MGRVMLPRELPELRMALGDLRAAIERREVVVVENGGAMRAVVLDGEGAPIPGNEALPPEAIEAGAEVLARFSPREDDCHEIAAEVFRAMADAQRRGPWRPR